MISPVLIAFSLFFGMLFFMELGRRIGQKIQSKDPDGAHKGISTIEGSLFGLMGLLIAFTFTGAASRFEDRRQLITQESNAIGTAYLRIELLASADQPKMKEYFKQYLDSRIATYQKVPDMVAVWAELKHSIDLQNTIWSFAISACKSTEAMTDAAKLLLPSINEMIDISNSRTVSAETHPPNAIFLLLGIFSLVGALFVGYGMAENKNRNFLYMIIFSIVMTLTVYLILDLEYPRLGFIRIDQADHLLFELRESMN